MAQMVITVIGDDRAGLVEAVAAAVTEHGGNWERSHMAELAGKFAGIVQVTLPTNKVAALTEALTAIETRGLLDVTVEEAVEETPTSQGRTVTLSLVGQDHAGIVHDISGALAEQSISIEEIETATTPAPMGGQLFNARLTIVVPDGVSSNEVERALEAVAHDLMVDLDFDT